VSLWQNPPQNQKSSFIEIFPFKAIQGDSKAFKAIQRFFRKKRLFIFSREASVGPSGAHRLSAKTSWTVNAKTWRTLLSVTQLDGADTGGLVLWVD
jgi:hypothetical protein